MMTKAIVASFLGIFLAFSPLQAQTSFISGEPYFVGHDRASAYQSLLRRQSFRIATTYMTAEEIQTTVAALTGYLHPAFIQFSDVLGRFDPLTGRRTTDQPSLISVLFMKMIATQIAAYVVERELFLDDAERIVFNSLNLDSSPPDSDLDGFIQSLHARWLVEAPGPRTIQILHDEFRKEEGEKGPAAGYAAVVAVLLQHGALYYY